MTYQIAFIGVGNMGNPMADQLVKAGKKVKAFQKRFTPNCQSLDARLAGLNQKKRSGKPVG